MRNKEASRTSVFRFYVVTIVCDSNPSLSAGHIFNGKICCIPVVAVRNEVRGDVTYTSKLYEHIERNSSPFCIKL